MLKRGSRRRAPLILCVEDEKYIRDELVAELERSGCDVLEADTGQHALDLIALSPPDLIVSDILMPGMGGLELLRQIRETRPDLNAIPFLFLSALSDRDGILESYRLGVDDYLVKPIDLDMFITRVQAKLRLLQRVEDRNRIQIAETTSLKLSPRELEVLHELVKGRKSSEIALHLKLSDHTVNDYIKAMYKKLGVRSRAEAVREAVRLGVVDLYNVS